MQPPTKKLSVRAILLAIFGCLVGVVVGLVLGSVLATALHVSPMEGGAGYFAVAIALIVVLIIGPSSILLALYWREVRRIWLFIGLILVCLSIVAIAAAGFGLWYKIVTAGLLVAGIGSLALIARELRKAPEGYEDEHGFHIGQPPILNAHGPTPLLEFELKPTDGQSIDSLAEVEPQLDTYRNSMPGYWHKDATENAGARAGYVELHYRTSQRLFVLKFPGHEDRIFRLSLPANPMSAKYRAWSDWKKPDFVAKAGDQPSRPSRGSDYQIRCKVDYQDR